MKFNGITLWPLWPSSQWFVTCLNLLLWQSFILPTIYLQARLHKVIGCKKLYRDLPERIKPACESCFHHRPHWEWRTARPMVMFLAVGSQTEVNTVNRCEGARVAALSPSACVHWVPWTATNQRPPFLTRALTPPTTAPASTWTPMSECLLWFQSCTGHLIFNNDGNLFFGSMNLTSSLLI